LLTALASEAAFAIRGCLPFLCKRFLALSANGDHARVFVTERRFPEPW